MDTKKKILILHVSAGHGHEKAARAIQEACRDISFQNQVELYDSLEFMTGFFGRGYKKIYLFLIQHFPWLWGLAYYVADISFVYFFIRPFRRFINHGTGRRLEALILGKNPDVVIATHFLPVEVVNYLKRKKLSHARLVTVITDYLPHAFWLSREVDLYAVGSEETSADLQKRGVHSEKIRISGIPVEKKFTQPILREAARTKLKLPSENFTLLITSGGAGIGVVEALVKKLLHSGKAAELLAVCGTNKNLWARLDSLSKKSPKLHAFGFVDTIDVLMAASDLVIGKGGGLTLTESLCVGKPMILFGSVPGQETRNARSMVRQGAARVANSLQEVVRLTVEIMNSPEILKEYTRAALRLARPKAAEDIVRMALSDG